MLKKFRYTIKKDKMKEKTKEKIEKLVENKSNSDKLDIIISEIKTIKTDIVEIKTDIVEIKEDLKKYKKQNADFQEAQINNFLVSILDHNRSTYLTNLLPIKNIYMPYSKDRLSEFDGLILYTPNQTKMPSISNELLDRANRVFHKSLKENISGINTIFTKPYLIIVESKRSLNKHKIDMKLKQMYEFMNILSKLDTIDLTNTSDEFKNLIETMQKESKLSINDLTTIDILFVLGSDDISLNLRKYVLQIEKGINKEDYNILSEILFKEDSYVKPHIKKIIESENTPKLVKSKLKHYNTLEELKLILKTDLSEFNMEYITDYLTSYEDLEHIFKTFKGKIGITQFNKIEFPQLIQFTTINRI
jgi:hypothetical protein